MGTFLSDDDKYAMHIYIYIYMSTIYTMRVRHLDYDLYMHMQTPPLFPVIEHTSMVVSYPSFHC